MKYQRPSPLSKKNLSIVIIFLLYSLLLCLPYCYADSGGAFTKASVGSSITVIGIGIVVYSIIRSYAPPYTPDLNSLTGKTIVITGATSGLGLESAKRLSVGGANLVLTARSVDKGQRAVEKVQQYLSENNLSETYNNQTIQYKVIDLDDLQSVKYNIVHYWDDIQTIDVLMNNAGVTALPKRQLTVDGYEQQIQSNHLGHFVLTALLFPKLTKDARIINLSSLAHIAAPFGIQFTNLWKADQYYIGPYVYGQTKLANILFTQELQRRVNAVTKYSSISVMAVHPGLVATEIIQKLGFDNLFTGLDNIFARIVYRSSQLGIIKTVAMGAATQVWLSSLPHIPNNMKGKYFVDCKVSTVLVRTDPAAARQLWEESEIMSGVKFNILPVTE